MKRSILAAAGMLLISAFAAGGAWAMSARDVAELHKAGVSDSIIIQKIHYSGTKFHLQPGDIAQLNKDGVPDEIVSVMLATEQKPQDHGSAGYYGPYAPYYYPYGPYYYPRVVVGLGFYGHYGSYYRGYYGRPYYGHPAYRGYGGYRGYPGHAGVPVAHPGAGRYK